MLGRYWFLAARRHSMVALLSHNDRFNILVGFSTSLDCRGRRAVLSGERGWVGRRVEWFTDGWILFRPEGSPYGS
jgi:hypothetical protein